MICFDGTVCDYHFYIFVIDILCSLHHLKLQDKKYNAFRDVNSASILKRNVHILENNYLFYRSNLSHSRRMI